MTSTDTQARPLTGLRVLETQGEIATRYCGRLLAVLGAEVTQVEDRSNALVAQAGLAGSAFNRWLDQGKVVVPTLQEGLRRLQASEGKRLVIAGQTQADVQIVDRVLPADRPDVVRLGLTWFGAGVGDAHWRGHDTVIQALTGVSFGFGLPEGPPILAQGHAPQLVAGVTAFIAGLAALMGGPDGPRRVDVNVLEAALCFTENGVLRAAGEPAMRSTRQGVNRFTPTYPAAIYPTNDGFAGITALTPAQWAATCQLIGRPELALEPRYTTALQRLACADEIDDLLRPRFAEKSTAWWVAEGARLRIPIAPSPRPRDLVKLDHWVVREAFAPLDGGVLAPALPFHFSFDGVVSDRPDGGANGPLTGVRIADFSMGWAGPLAARYLGDLGAEVLKIESKARPDWWRGWEAVAEQDPPAHELPLGFLAVNRSKRGVDLDLTAPQGKAAAEAIIRRADLVIENQGPGVMDRLGLGQADQRRIRPGVISITMPPFGRRGPLSGLRAYGSTVEQASGLPFVNGMPDWAPCLQHVAYGDPVAGLYAAAGALTALYARGTLGGAEIDLCQVECLFQLGADSIIADQFQGLVRQGSRRVTEAPVCVVRAAGDEAWLCVAVDGSAAWRNLCDLLADDTLGAGWSLSERRARADEIEAAIARWANGRTPYAAASALQERGVAAAPVLPTHRVFGETRQIAPDYWLKLDRRYVGEHLTPQAALRFDGKRLTITRPAPTLGEHTAEVLGELA